MSSQFTSRDWNKLHESQQDLLKACASMHKKYFRRAFDLYEHSWYLVPISKLQAQCSNLHFPDTPLSWSGMKTRLKRAKTLRLIQWPTGASTVWIRKDVVDFVMSEPTLKNGQP